MGRNHEYYFLNSERNTTKFLERGRKLVMAEQTRLPAPGQCGVRLSFTLWQSSMAKDWLAGASLLVKESSTKELCK